MNNANEYKVKQIQPNHADHISGYREKYLKEMFENEFCVAQPKYDGERMLIHFNDGEVYCTSRRYSKKTNRFMENQDKLPVLKPLAEKMKQLGFAYTVLDCEAYAKDWSTAVGILHSLPERAVELQKTDVLHFAIFDCLFYNGYDYRDHSYNARISAAYDIVNQLNYAPLHIVKHFTLHSGSTMISDVGPFAKVHSIEEAQQFMQIAIDAGYEGIVVKSIDKTYYDKAASLKCKKFETVDVVVIGYDQGRGKYADTVGALHVGYFDKYTNTFIKISNVNCSTDEERNYWRDNWKSLQYSVIEVKCQEITDRSLRHPVYIRRRNDKDYTMCTKETIFKES